MIGELLYVRCGRCPRHLEPAWCSEAPTLHAEVDGYEVEIALFASHSEAIAAAEVAGWLLRSESIGGDVCPVCQEIEAE